MSTETIRANGVRELAVTHLSGRRRQYNKPYPEELVDEVWGLICGAKLRGRFLLKRAGQPQRGGLGKQGLRITGRDDVNGQILLCYQGDPKGPDERYSLRVVQDGAHTTSLAQVEDKLRARLR